MNEYDSSRIADLLRLSHGCHKIDDPAEADILLLNTCAVREKAEEKVFSLLGRWRKIKLTKKDLIIGVGGCVASQDGEMIMKRAPYINLVFGPQTIHRLPLMLDNVLETQKPTVDITFPEIEKFDNLPPINVGRVNALVSIMEGCSKYCSFCVVPYTRGTEFSRSCDDVIAEVYGLAQQGVREVNLLGQNVNGYRGLNYKGRVVEFAELIHYIAAVEGVDRIRYTTSHPIDITEELVEVYTEIPELVDHLHLPVQSGSDRILKLMKRGYTVEDYLKWIEKFRAVRPNLSISSDFIVGFPGETDTDFQQTMDLIEEIGYDQSFSFIYSARPGTPAADLIDDVSMAVKKERLAVLQSRINKMAAQISQKMVHSDQSILVYGPSRNDSNQMSGRTENNRVVNFDGSLELVGQFVKLRITESLPNSLRGEIIDDRDKKVA